MTQCPTSYGLVSAVTARRRMSCKPWTRLSRVRSVATVTPSNRTRSQVFVWGSCIMSHKKCFSVTASSGRRCLCSAAHGDLLVSRMRTTNYGPQNFAVSWPSISNVLLPSTLGQFQNTLNMLLFRLAYVRFSLVLAVYTI